MKPNVFPFFFLPGVGIIGLIAGGWAGLTWALAAWAAVAIAGTVVHVVRNISEQWAGADAHRVDASPPRRSKR